MNTGHALGLEAVNISKRFGALRALDNVSLSLQAGTVHALLGENGAGKSTLVKCIMGYYLPDTGDVLVGDRQQTIRDPREAQTVGIGMVYQHFTLIPNMTVLENLTLARPHLSAVVDWRMERRRIEQKMGSMPFQLPLDANINDLAAGEKQKLEIVKQLMLDCKILILDEPTSVLTPSEAGEVLGLIRAIVLRGDLSVLLITHKFREVLVYADKVTVLRKGKNAGSIAVVDADEPRLAAMMVGEAFVHKPLQRQPTTPDRARLEINNLSVNDDRGLAAVKHLSLAVRGGEIVGVAGVSGNGQRELVEVLDGQRAAQAGQIHVNGEGYSGQRALMLKHKFHCLPEEPLLNACVAGMSVAENLTFRHFDRAPFSLGGWWLDRRAIKARAMDLIRQFNIRTSGPDAALGELSGGNVQRTVLARELAEPAEVLVVANPCFGLDFAAAEEIRARIMEERNGGAAVLLVSEDLDEILSLSDRVVVISGGTFTYETTPAEADPAIIGRHMAGHHAAH